MDALVLKPMKLSDGFPIYRVAGMLLLIAQISPCILAVESMTFAIPDLNH